MNRRSRHRTSRERRHVGDRVPVDIILNKYVGGRPYLCRASNIGPGGLLVHRVREPASQETRVGLQFQLPGDDRVITCAGQIVHEHNWIDASGIRITSISAEHQALLDSFVAGA